MTEPKLILVKPQLAENIGATARAMANFGLTKLRMVAPKIKLPNETARRMAAGAESILDNAEIFETFDEAVADINFLLATTARPRDMVKAVLSPERAMLEIRSFLEFGVQTEFTEKNIASSSPRVLESSPKAAILFGPERTGLENEHIVKSDRIISIPTNPDFSSLNIAQSVVILAYEWLKSEGKHSDFVEDFGSSIPASKEETIAFFEHLETELVSSNFFKSAEKRPGMMANLTNTLSRARFSDQDIRTLRGVIRALVHKY